MAVQPRVVLAHPRLLLPHLESKPYALRSALVHAMGIILVPGDHTVIGPEKEDGRRRRQTIGRRSSQGWRRPGGVGDPC